MKCPHCDNPVTVSKSLKRRKSAVPDECPECGEELNRESQTALVK